jgi:hypothetical protein
LDLSQVRGPYIHVDTTLQIDRLKAPARATLVKNALAPFKFRSTSTYARYEFLRSWVRDLVWLYTNSEKCKRRSDIDEAILRSFGAQQAPKSRLTRTLEIINAYLKTGENEELPADVQVVRLRAHLARCATTVQTAWGRAVHYEFNGTSCIRAQEVPRLAPNGKMIFTLNDCRRGKIHCHVHRFFEAHQARFEQLAAKADALGRDASAQFTKAAEQIRRAAGDPEHLCDNTKCARIGDSIIALDGMQLPVFGANNDAEWKPIAEVLGKQLFNPFKDAKPPSAVG